MNKKVKTFLQKLKNPPVWAQITTYLVTLLSAVGALLILFVDYEKSALAALAYSLFFVAAISLAYSVYLIVRTVPVWKKKIIAWARKYEFTYLLLRNFGFRTIIFTIGSLCISIAFGFFNGVVGIYYRSVWNGALAAYYLCLAIIRGNVLLYHKRKRKKSIEDFRQEAWSQAKHYRNYGIILLLLNLALSSMIGQMVFEDRAFHYADWTLYAHAAYAFYKIAMSIVNLFKARKQDDLTVQAIRNINFADAAVSILALQTALLHTFTVDGRNVALFNLITGSIVSIVIVSIAVLMIVAGIKQMKAIKSEKVDETV